MKSITNENNLGSSGGGSGIELVDINPDKIYGAGSLGYFVVARNGYKQYLPCAGYNKISLRNASTENVTGCYFCDSTGANVGNIPLSPSSTWSDYIDIPQGAICVVFNAISRSNAGGMGFSLLTDKQVIPTKVTADINPNLLTSDTDSASASVIVQNSSTHFQYIGDNKIPCQGYKRVNLGRPSTAQFNYFQYRFQLADGSFTSAIPFPTSNNWIGWVNIPNNAVCVQLSTTYSSSLTIYYALSTSES